MFRQGILQQFLISIEVFMIKYGDCGTCRSWCVAPKEFKETKHFMVCPVCGNYMYLISTNPLLFGKFEKNRVIPTLKLHGDKNV